MHSEPPPTRRGQIPNSPQRKEVKGMRAAGIRIGLVLACVAALFVVATQAGAKPTKTTGRIGVGIGGFGASPLIEGIVKGYFHGFSFVDTHSGIAAVPLLKAGKLSAALDVSAPPVAIALANHIPVKVVWVDFAEKDALVVKPGIKTAQDLKGKKIAITFGSITEVLIDQYLAAHGMSPSDVTLVDLQSDQYPAAFKSGEVDAVYASSPWWKYIEDEGGTELVSTTDPNLHMFSGNFRGPKAQAFVCGLAKSQRDFLAHPVATSKIIAARIGATTAQVRALLPVNLVAPVNQTSTKYLGYPSQLAQVVYGTGQLLYKGGKIPNLPTMAQVQAVFDPSFAKAAIKGKCLK
jgi:taurine transport system substrate-binding protein